MIPLPPLPHALHGYYAVPMYSPDQARAIQRKAMRVALEAAAELVHTEYLDAFLFGTKDAATLQELERATRALEIGT